MSLTNPNKVVTEERLSEFYGQILPYMGGMPDVLANKFSKGDLYSTDEKMIGCWTDSKPLYMKVVSGVSSASDGWSRIASLGSDHIIVMFDAYLSDDNVRIVQAGYNSGVTFEGMANNNGSSTVNGDFSVYVSGASHRNKPVYAILLYTKTTDSPIAIGTDTDYSTDEKIVGTWIDGKSIWQNTVSTGGNVPSGATLILRTAMASTGYDTILYTKTS